MSTKNNVLTLITLSFVCFIFLLFPACDGEADNKGKNEVIKIGVTVPLTGSASVWGNYTLKGAQLAAKEVNEKGGIHGKNIELVIEDTKGNAKDGINAFMNLLNSDIKVVLDDAVSSVALAIAPIATQKKVVIISTGATNPLLTGISPYYFRVWNSDLEEGSFAATYAYKELNIRNVCILHVFDDYGKGLADVFEKKFKDFGNTTIDDILTYDLNQTDFKNVLIKLKNKVNKAWYLVSKPKETVVILKQAKELGLENRIIIGSVAFHNDQFLATIKDFYGGRIYYPYPLEPTGDLVSIFSEKYKKEFGQAPGTTSSEGYDALRIFVKAIEIVGYDAVKIKDYLRRMDDFTGPSGITRFDPYGDVHKPMEMKIVN